MSKERKESAIKNRYDIVVVFEQKGGSIGNSPDDNGPRVQPETGICRVTDACLKRKIRNYVDLIKDGAKGYRIYIKNDAALNTKDDEAFEAIGIEDASTKAKSKDKKANLKEAIKATGKDVDTLVRDYMTENFYDIRTFGAVMTTMVAGNLNCGQVKGPVQIGISESVDPVTVLDLPITRCCISTEADREDKQTEMGGHKYVIPYGLFRCNGHISANLAQKTTGFSEEDLELLWDAILNMFEHDHSASSGDPVVKKLIIFKHDSELGNAPSDKLFNLVKITRKKGVDVAQSFDDYDVTIDMEHLPAGVHCEVREQ